MWIYSTMLKTCSKECAYQVMLVLPHQTPQNFLVLFIQLVFVPAPSKKSVTFYNQ